MFAIIVLLTTVTIVRDIVNTLMERAPASVDMVALLGALHQVGGWGLLMGVTGDIVNTLMELCGYSGAAGGAAPGGWGLRMGVTVIMWSYSLMGAYVGGPISSV